ncbi:GNAT family N-acetyltransferase [Microbulbifer halophilus]|uniref:GNAT family N-acetyltransferase n=1 Tax=Microbulbifer halophilus TaxID=453963 RepID=A0ABW5EGF0_9GAMM|nr:GNAT family N-acetyltransferase [Microbulbifer halophilus]MCW8128369.1 GNAT family N-acetyltransferase [Microbulbifer halophilus]
MLRINEVPPSEAPMELLLVADPSEDAIKRYLNQARCFIAYSRGAIAGVCVVKPIARGTLELMNIAVSPSIQQNGIGTRLLQHVIEKVKESGARRLEVGTGTFGHQLTFYQRQGFRVEHISKDFFLKNYPEPIIENGVQHKDMLRLSLEFPDDNSHQRTI